MSTRHLVDPQLLPFLDIFPVQMELSLEKLPRARGQSRALAALLPPPPENGVKLAERYIPGPGNAPDVRILVYTPPGQATMRPALLHIHGGGYVMGSPEINHARNQGLSAELDCVIVSVDYRLPPEHPFPASIEDCYAALKWLHAHAAEMKVAPGKIAIGGESAGGGLAAALGLLARDRQEVPLAFQLLIYPMLDDRTGTSIKPNPNTGEFLWPVEANRFGWTSLLGQMPGGDDVSCYASAARADNVAGLPPTFIAAASLDLLCGENIAYAQRLLEAGVATELHVYPAAYHGFDLAADAQVSKQFERDYRAALCKAFA